MPENYFFAIIVLLAIMKWAGSKTCQGTVP